MTYIKPSTVKEMIHYDHEEGKLFWLERGVHLFKSKSTMSAWNSSFSGKETFKQIGKNGYKYGVIYRKKFYAHRVAWAIYYGEWPDNQIDHINGNKLDNRISNLRHVSNTENQRNTRVSSNNKTGVIGVYFNIQKGKYHARIGVDGTSVNLGYFSSIDDARKARLVAEDKYGYHRNHGREK